MSKPVQVSQAVKQFLAWLSLRARPRTVEFYSTFLDRFARHVEDIALDEVKRLHVETFSARFHPLAAVCRFLKWCFEVAELIDRNPSAKVRVPRNGQRSRVLGRAERVSVRRSCKFELRRALLAMEESACRPQELRAITWKMIFGPSGPAQIGAALGDGYHWFQLRDYKSRERRSDPTRPRIIPITPRLGRLLERMRRDAVTLEGNVFTAPCGRAWTANSLRCAMRRLRAKLKQAGRVEVTGLVPYTYRHTRATDLARSGVNAMLLKEWMGHARVETTGRYCHFALQDLSAIARRRLK